MALSEQNRLRSSKDFGTVHRKGKRASTPHLAVRALKMKSLEASVSVNQKAWQKPTLKANRASDKQAEREGVGEKSSALSSCFGISISKKVSKRAVVRNRIKRQIRAAIREQLPGISPGWQIVIVVRPSAVECDFADFLRELEHLLKKLKVLRKAV